MACEERRDPFERKTPLEDTIGPSEIIMGHEQGRKVVLDHENTESKAGSSSLASMHRRTSGAAASRFAALPALLFT